MEKQKLYEKQADVFVSVWSLIKCVCVCVCRHLINMWLRSEKEFWFGFKMVLVYYKSF